MARKKATSTKEVGQYTHDDKDRVNNPPVGLVTPDTDKDADKKSYEYDPHLDPQLQWAGKAEHTSFAIDTVSLHVHERIDPKTIIESVRKEDEGPKQLSLFETAKRPLREEIEFYKHRDGWTNRLVAGDSLLVMNSLLEKEGMGGKVQMIYFDPPYGIKYGSNFQPFINKRDVKDGNDQDLTAEPEMIKAFRDTWELGIHSYLTYLRDRLLLAKELLHESGSIFVQISDENLHHIKELLAEVCGNENYVATIPFRKKTMPLGAKFLEGMHDYLIWFAKDKAQAKYRQLYQSQNVQGDFHWGWIELPNGSRRKMTKEEINNHTLLPPRAKIFRLVPLWPASFSSQTVYPITFRGKEYIPPKGLCWLSGPEGMNRLINANRIEPEGEGNLRYVYFLKDYNLKKLISFWDDTTGARNQKYVVQTSEEVIKRCIYMTTDPGDLVFDPTCGGGTTAFVAEQLGRRWITCDTSRIATSLTKQRLVTANFEYFKLAHPDEGVGSGFVYKILPRISSKLILNCTEIVPNLENKKIEKILNKYAPIETLYDQPLTDRKKNRITGPFTVEAVPAPVVKSIEEIGNEAPASDTSVARSGETLRQTEWRDELFKSGIRAKGGQKIEFTRIEPLSGTRYLQAEGETREVEPKRVFISFGPEHAPLEQRQVELAIEEAMSIKPKPDIVLFAAFQFDAEAAKDIDETNWPGVMLLRVQMNADMFTEDLKKNKAGNESFWLMGQPDVRIKQITKGEDKGKIQVEVAGFDYYDPKSGNVESGNKGDIAMWMLDTDYDGRSLLPRQVFFPMAGAKEGWSRLAKNLKAEIDEEKIESFRGTVSLPFKPGRQIAVKIIDARGVESLKIEKM
jgi:adenine-specific DNA-methyltransferase